MPELPDVETFKRYLDATSLYQRITGVDVQSAYVLKGVSARELARRLNGRRFESSCGHGPDALDISFSQFQGIFVNHRGALKAILLNQKLIAGIGNIYADEILFRARIHPATESGRVGETTVGRLFRATCYILQKAIEAKADADRMPKSWLLPHRGKGGKCPRCGRELKSATIGGRTAWFCAHCQKSAPEVRLPA